MYVVCLYVSIKTQIDSSDSDCECICKYSIHMAIYIIVNCVVVFVCACMLHTNYKRSSSSIQSGFYFVALVGLSVC